MTIFLTISSGEPISRVAVRHQITYDEVVAKFSSIIINNKTEQVNHSYILELKYLPKDKFETQAAEQWKEAINQIHNYTADSNVRQLCQRTQLHCIVMQFCGWELTRIEEV